MIQYIDNMIKATSGEDICLMAKAIDAYGDTIAACSFNLFDCDDNHLFSVEGVLNEEKIWEFYLPAKATTGLKGKYWYCVCDEDHVSLCFKCPMYLV